MKLLFKLRWPKCLREIITIQPPSLLCKHCGSATSLRASCVTLQTLPRDLICTLKLLLQTRALIIKICFQGMVCEQAKQLILFLCMSHAASVQSSPCHAPAERYKPFPVGFSSAKQFVGIVVLPAGDRTQHRTQRSENTNLGGYWPFLPGESARNSIMQKYM